MTSHSTVTEPYEGAARYQQLKDRLIRLERADADPLPFGSKRWPVGAFMGLLAHLGLEAVRFNAWGYCHAPDDARVPADRRETERDKAFAQELAWLDSLRSTPAERDELVELAHRRHAWLKAHPLYDWQAGLSLVFAGRRPVSREPTG